MDYWGRVADSDTTTTVTVEFYYNVDIEEGWDWFNLNVDRAGTWEQDLHVSGVVDNEHYTTTIEFAPEDYVNDNQFHIQFQFTSDGKT